MQLWQKHSGLLSRTTLCISYVCVASGDREMKQLDVELTTTTTTTTSSSEEQMSADYLLLHTAFKAGEEQRRRHSGQTASNSMMTESERRQSVPRIFVDHDGLDQHHRRTHSLKCPSSSPPATRRQSVRRAGSVKSTPPRSARNASNASPKAGI